MPNEQLDLLKELSGGQLYSSAIFGTYQFDGVFFEEEVLPVLNQLDVANIVVLTDTQAYTAANELTQAGQAYYIDHVRCPGIHHPKFVALFGHDYGRAFVGSANLTEQGWQRSGELMTVVEYPGDTGTTKPLFAQLRGFIEESMDQIHGSRATAAIEEAFRDAPWLPESPATSDDEQLQLIHNFSEALLPQILDQIGDRSITEIEVCSPFFSGSDDAVFETLCSCNPDTITINLQPDRVGGFQSEVLESPCFDGIDVTVNKIALSGDDADRYLHAKLFLLKGPAGVWTCYGSPNFTTPALLETGDGGNIELGVLRYEPEPDYFDYLLDGETGNRESLDPNSVTHRLSSPSDTGDEECDFYLTDAYIETDGSLIVEHEEATPSRATAHIDRAGDDEGIKVDLTEPGDGRIQCQDERIPQICRQSAQVRVTLELPDDTMTSDARWISLPTLEQTPRPSEVKTVETSKGRDGLLEVLNRLPSWGLICKFLDNVDFKSMEIEGGGSRIGSRDPDSDDGEEMEPWDPKDRNEILDEKKTALLNAIEATHDDLLLDPTDPERFESLVNQYVSLSKLVLWWCSQDQDALSHLGQVRTATETIGEFIRGLSRHTEPEAARAIEKEHSLFEHAAIIMCYVDEIQQQAGYDTGPNKQVYAIFRDTNREVLTSFGEVRGQDVPATDRIKDCISEYSAIGAVSVSAKRVEYYCKDLMGATDEIK